MTGKTYEPPLYIEMDFEEALARFAQTDKKEADALAQQSKKKKAPEDKPPGARKKRVPD